MDVSEREWNQRVRFLQKAYPSRTQTKCHSINIFQRQREVLFKNIPFFGRRLKVVFDGVGLQPLKRLISTFIYTWEFSWWKLTGWDFHPFHGIWYCIIIIRAYFGGFLHSGCFLWRHSEFLFHSGDFDFFRSFTKIHTVTKEECNVKKNQINSNFYQEKKSSK